MKWDVLAIVVPMLEELVWISDEMMWNEDNRLGRGYLSSA